jgi:hypothetical protein
MLKQKTAKFIFAFLGLIGLAFPLISSSANISGENRLAIRTHIAAESAPKFSSAYTDTTKQCKGAEPTFTCTGYGNYRIVMGIGGVFADARVESTKSDYSLQIANRQSVGWNPKIEWRMANGKPFAVILRVDINDENAEIPKKIGESLIIKGLQGHENIDATIDAKTPQANKKAREIADGGYAAASGQTGYHPRGAIQQMYSLTSTSKSMTPQDAIKIVESLRYLKR